MKKLLFRFLGPCLVVLVFVLAIRLLYGIIKDYSVHDIVDSMRQIPAVWIAAAAALTVVNYFILIGYDYLAVRYVEAPLPLWKIALVSFAGYACSYNIGATLAGTSIRYRLYSAWGVPPMKILQLLVILGLTFWFGVFALAGVIFLVDPPKVPNGSNDVSAGASDSVAAISEKLPSQGHRIKDEWVHWVREWLRWLSQYMRPIGGILLALAVAYVGLSALHKGSVRGVPLPPFSLTVKQIIVASADLLVAAWVLFMLLPRMKGIDYPELVAIYMMSYVLVVLSHVPGGLGVLEPTILVLIPHQYRLQAFAALIVFRVIYYWIPMLLAMIMLGTYEFSLRKHWLASADESPAANPPNDA